MQENRLCNFDTESFSVGIFDTRIKSFDDNLPPVSFLDHLPEMKDSVVKPK